MRRLENGGNGQKQTKLPRYDNILTMSTRHEAETRNEEGLRLMQAGELDRAVAAFSTAIRLDPQLYDAYRRRSAALSKLGRLKEAKADSRRADLLIGGSRERESDLGERVSRTAFAWTAIPVSGLGIISTFGARDEGFYTFWYAAAALWVVVLLVLCALVLRRVEAAAGGVLSGFGIGSLVLIVTWFINNVTA